MKRQTVFRVKPLWCARLTAGRTESLERRRAGRVSCQSGPVGPPHRSVLPLEVRSRACVLVLLSSLICGLFILVFERAPRKQAWVAVQFQRDTNGLAVITVTNQSTFNIHYLLKIERKVQGKWPTYLSRVPGADTGDQAGILSSRQARTVSVGFPAYKPRTPWRVSVFYYRSATNSDFIRFGACRWLARAHLLKLADWVGTYSMWGKASGPEVGD